MMFNTMRRITEQVKHFALYGTLIPVERAIRSGTDQCAAADHSAYVRYAKRQRAVYVTMVSRYGTWSKV